MDKQKIILPVVIILVFGAIVFFGVRSLSDDDQLPQVGNVTSPSWDTPATPTQSPPVNGEDVPSGAIKLRMSAEGITPSAFEVKAGEEVLLSVASGDEWTHILRFKDASLKDVAVGVGPEQVRMIRFYAPSQPGQYEFFCAVPGHKARGENGIMTVK